MTNSRRKQQKIAFTESLRVQKQWLDRPISKAFLIKNQELQAGPRIFGPIISKSTQRLGACGGQISLGSTGRLKGLTKGFGPNISQGHPFVGLERDKWGNGLTQDWINSSSDDPMNLSNNRSNDPTFPYTILMHRN
jgi:hypothetical protein